MVLFNGILIMLIPNTLMGGVLLLTVHHYSSSEVVYMHPCRRALKAKRTVV